MQIPFLVTFKVIKALDECGINYLIGGSLGSSIHGIPRATLDADLVTDINNNQVERLVAKLKAEFMIDADMIYDAINRHSCFNIIHLKTMFKVDIFILKNTSYEIMEFNRRKPELLSDPDTFVNVATPEDIVLNKLIWYQDGGGVSERQWDDAKGVLKVQGDTLDYQYLEHWAEILGIKELIARLRQELKKPF
jgi:hypothetical protein